MPPFSKRFQRFDPSKSHAQIWRILCRTLGKWGKLEPLATRDLPIEQKRLLEYMSFKVKEGEAEIWIKKAYSFIRPNPTGTGFEVRPSDDPDNEDDKGYIRPHLWLSSGDTDCVAVSTSLLISSATWSGWASLHPAEEHLRGIWGRLSLHVRFAGVSRFHQDLGWLSCLRSPTFRHAVDHYVIRVLPDISASFCDHCW